ncbi:putative reverse transcriptase domain-containing protein, partial [Tanacetum coccineum]
ANLPPPDHAADLPDDEPVQLEPASIIPHHAPAQLEGYVGDDDREEDEEEDPDEDPEEEPIEQVVLDQNNMDGFALHPLLQLAGNMNWWLIEDDDEKLEEDGVDDEEIEMDEEDEDHGGDDNEDEAEVINAYKEVDPLNRPPPTFDEETEFVPHIVPIADVTTRYKTKKKMAKKFKEDKFRMNRHEYDITTLDMAEEPPIYSVSVPRADDPYAMVRDATMAAREDDDDDTTTSRDTQPFEPRESPRNLEIMPPKGVSAAAFSKLVADKVAEALEANHAAKNNPNVAGGSGGNGGQGLDVANGKSWTYMRKMMMEEFCPDEEVQRLENKLGSLKLRDTSIAAYTQRFNELALLCAKAVPTEKNKVELYIKGLPEIIKGETTSSRPIVLNEAVRMAHTLMEQKIQDKAERVA